MCICINVCLLLNQWHHNVKCGFACLSLTGRNLRLAREGALQTDTEHGVCHGPHGVRGGVQASLGGHHEGHEGSEGSPHEVNS